MDKGDGYIEHKLEYTLLDKCIHFCLFNGFFLAGAACVISVISSNSFLLITLILFFITIFTGYLLLMDMALLRSRHLLNDEGIFTYDCVSNTWVYLKWEDIKSAYYRSVRASRCLIISTKELTKKQVKKAASKGYWWGRYIIDDDTVYIFFAHFNPRSNDVFQFIESKLDCVSWKWYDIFKEADNP